MQPTHELIFLNKLEFYIYVDVYNGARLQYYDNNIRLRAYVRLADANKVLEHIIKRALTKYKKVYSDAWIDNAESFIKTVGVKPCL